MNGSPLRRIMVTGAAGYLGGAIARHLTAQPEVEVVVGLDRIDEQPRGYEFVRRDIRDGLADVLEEHRVEAIVHHAFLIQPSRDEREARTVNVDATAQLAEDAKAAGVRLIVYPSSTTTYGPIPGSGFHPETDPQRPAPGFAYSEHKVEAEEILRQGAVTTSILRCCVVLGPGAQSFITSSLSLPVMPVVAGTDPEMQFLHIDDYVDAVQTALTAGRSGTWNVAGSGTVSFRQLAGLAGSRVVSVPEPVLRWLVDTTWRLRLQNRSDASGLPLAQHPWLASIDRIEHDLGWSPRYSSRDAAEYWSGAL